MKIHNWIFFGMSIRFFLKMISVLGVITLSLTCAHGSCLSRISPLCIVPEFACNKATRCRSAFKSRAEAALP